MFCTDRLINKAIQLGIFIGLWIATLIFLVYYQYTKPEVARIIKPNTLEGTVNIEERK